MARGETVPSDVEDIIRRVHEADPSLKAAAVAIEVRKKLGKQRSRDYTWPGDVCVRTHIRKQVERRREVEASGKDEPWEMSVLEDQNFPPMPAGGLAAVMAAYRFALLHHATLTIRQAKWVARLSEPVRAIFAPLNPTEGHLVAETIIRAVAYARVEIESELTGKPFHTSGMDRRLALRLDKDSILYDFIPQLAIQQPTLMPIEELENLAARDLHDPDSYLVYLGTEVLSRTPLPKATQERVDRWKESRRKFMNQQREDEERRREHLRERDEKLTRKGKKEEK